MVCVVPGCKSHPRELKVIKGEKSFHRFPVDLQLKKKWINNIRRPNWQPTKNSRICSLHFDPQCYRNDSPQVSARKILHSYAVPTIFPNQPAYSHQKIPKKRMLVMRKELDISVIAGQSGPGQQIPNVLRRILTTPKRGNTSTPPSNKETAPGQPSDVSVARPQTCGRITYDTVDNPDDKLHDNDPLQSQESEDEPDDEEVPTVPDTTEDTPEQQKEPQFSWQRESAVVPTDDAERCIAPVEETLLLETEDGGAQTQTEDHSYRCNVCSSEITHFLYTCVECSDFDLCGACEARGEHATHYVLRIPGHRPHGEVSAVRRAIRRILLSDGGVENARLYALHEEFDVKIEPKEDPTEPDPIDDQAEIPHSEIIQKDSTEFFVDESVSRVDLHKDNEQFDVELQIDKFKLERSVDESEINTQHESDSEINTQHDSEDSIRDETEVNNALQQQLALSQITHPIPPNAKNILIVEPGGKVSSIRMSDQVGVQYIPSTEQQEIQERAATKQLTLTIQPLPIIQKDKEIRKTEILKRLLLEEKRPIDNIPTTDKATEIQETEITEKVVINPLPIVQKDKEILKREILKRLKEKRLIDNIITTDEAATEIQYTEMTEKVVMNPILSKDKEIQKREILKRLEDKRPTENIPITDEEATEIRETEMTEKVVINPILPKDKEIQKRLEEAKSLRPIRPTILANKNEGPRILIPKSSIHRHMPGVLKRRDVKDGSDTDCNRDVKSDTSKNPPDSSNSSNKTFEFKEAYKRSLELSKTLQESAKKMKVKEITLLPVPEYIKHKFEGSGRVSLQKPRPEEMPSTSSQAQDKNDPDNSSDTKQM